MSLEEGEAANGSSRDLMDMYASSTDAETLVCFRLPPSCSSLPRQ